MLSRIQLANLKVSAERRCVGSSGSSFFDGFTNDAIAPSSTILGILSQLRACFVRASHSPSFSGPEVVVGETPSRWGAPVFVFFARTSPASRQHFARVSPRSPPAPSEMTPRRSMARAATGADAPGRTAARASGHQVVEAGRAERHDMPCKVCKSMVAFS